MELNGNGINSKIAIELLDSLPYQIESVDQTNTNRFFAMDTSTEQTSFGI